MIATISMGTALAADVLRPLSLREITQLLQSILEDDESAFDATAASLYGWCRPDDVDLALAVIAAPMPIPRCVHGRPWNNCSGCPSVRQIAAAN